MDATCPKPRYVIVSPVKDEERYVERTLRAVAGQTMTPELWVIVDDGCRDNTPGIIRRYVEKYPFIRLVRHPHAGIRQTGSAVMRAFKHGFDAIGTGDYDFIVKLDCDLSFESDYFEKLFARFLADPRLGIASGIYRELAGDGEWKEIKMPSYHAAGACKVIRKKCFEEIGGFIVAAGWDTVDEIRAMTLGWKTGHFADLEMHHHKTEGSGIGMLRTSVMHGQIYYLTGGDVLFFLLKVLHRMSSKPPVIGALALLWGYLKAALDRKTPLVTGPEAKCYRALLRGRLQDTAKSLSARASTSVNR